MKLVKADKSDYEHFCAIRKEGMKPHVEREGLPWDEEYEEIYHRLLFDRGIKRGSLHRVVVDDKIVGYMGISPLVEIGIWLDKDHRDRCIGTEAIESVLEANKDNRVILDVFKSNPALRLYERLGFKQYAENEHFLYLTNP